MAVAEAAKFKGVFYDRRSERFVARLNRDGKRHHLGSFDTAEEASEAYLAALSEQPKAEPTPRTKAPPSKPEGPTSAMEKVREIRKDVLTQRPGETVGEWDARKFAAVKRIGSDPTLQDQITQIILLIERTLREAFVERDRLSLMDLRNECEARDTVGAMRGCTRFGALAQEHFVQSARPLYLIEPNPVVGQGPWVVRDPRMDDPEAMEAVRREWIRRYTAEDPGRKNTLLAHYRLRGKSDNFS